MRDRHIQVQERQRRGMCVRRHLMRRGQRPMSDCVYQSLVQLLRVTAAQGDRGDSVPW